MNPNRLRLAALMLLVFPLGAAWAAATQDEARQWLERMIQAAQTLNYKGTFVYVQGQALEAMHIVHISGEEGVRQRLHSLSGAPREVVVTNNGTVTCLLPKRKIVLGTKLKHSPFPLSVSRDLGKLEKYYRFEIVGDDRIADRKTRIIAINPRDEWRFGYRLWLDQATALVLRSALLNEKGQVIEQLMFTNLEVKPELDSKQWSLPESIGSANPSSKVQQAPETVTQSHWEVADPPEGFVQFLHYRFTSDPNGYPTEHILFTDGLAMVSVFLEKLDGKKPVLTSASQMGAMNTFGVVIDNYQAVVVGEVPQVTVKRIATSLRRAEDAAAQ